MGGGAPVEPGVESGMDRVVAEVLALFAQHGHATYSERVTMEQHARQAAALARAEGAADALVLAALLLSLIHI